MFEPTIEQRQNLYAVAGIIGYGAITIAGDKLTLHGIHNREPATFPDWHSLIDHLRRELAQWHADTQAQLWQVIAPEVQAQIDAIVHIDHDGY